MINLSSAYDMLWHRSMLLKLYNTFQDRCMVQVLNEIIDQHLKTVVGDGLASQTRALKDGVPKGLFLLQNFLTSIQLICHTLLV